MLCLSLAIFIRTQTPGMQHCMPYVFMLFLVFSAGFFSFVRQIQNKYIAQGALLTVVCLFAVSNGSSLFPQAQVPHVAEKILPHHTWPLVHKSYDTYQLIAKDIATLNAKTAVLASSGILNNDMLFHILPKEAQKKYVGICHVDLRDRLRSDLFLADYVLVADPVQTHLRTGTQLVVTEPATSILKGTDIGKAYTKVKSYDLEQGVKAILFKKTRGFTAEEVTEHLEKYFAVYPEWRNSFDTPAFKAVLCMYDVRLGDKCGYLSYWNNAIDTHVGETLSTRFSVPGGLIDGIAFTSTNTSCNASDPIRITRIAQTDTKDYTLPKGGTIELNIQFDEANTFEIAKGRSSNCGQVRIKMLNSRKQ